MEGRSGERRSPVILMPGDEFRLDRATGELKLIRHGIGREVDLAERLNLGQIKGAWVLYAQNIGEIEYLMMCKMAAIVHGLTAFKVEVVADSMLSCFVETPLALGADGV